MVDFEDRWWQVCETLQGDLERADREVGQCEEALEKAKQRLAFVEAKADTVLKTIESPGLRKSLAAQPHDQKLRGQCSKLKGWDALRKSGVPDEQIVAKLRDWKDYDYSSQFGPKATGGTSPRFWIGQNYGKAEFELKGKQLVAEVRRVLEIPQPKTAPEKTTKATKPANATVKPKPAGVQSRVQTYGQWLATLRGICPDTKHLDLGADWDDPLDTDTRRLPELVKLQAKKSPSESKQILIAAGWMDQWADEEHSRLIQWASTGLIKQRIAEITNDLVFQTKDRQPLQREADKLIRRQPHVAGFEKQARAIGIELRGSMAPASTSGKHKDAKKIAKSKSKAATLCHEEEHAFASAGVLEKVG